MRDRPIISAMCCALGSGAELLLFDGHSGEWLARIAEAGKKRMTLLVERKTREPESIPDVWLAFAPVKRAQTDWLVEKATELGAARLIPVMTQRTIAERVQARPAREHRDRGRRAVRADAGAANRRAGAAQALRRRARSRPAASISPMKPAASAVARLSPKDRRRSSSVPRAASPTRSAPSSAAPGHAAISLGPRILRAETAALAALSAYMALAGDWR